MMGPGHSNFDVGAGVLQITSRISDRVPGHDRRSGLYVLANQCPGFLGMNRIVTLFALGELCYAINRLGLLYDSQAGVGQIK